MQALRLWYLVTDFLQCFLLCTFIPYVHLSHINIYPIGLQVSLSLQ